jgi:hypothetical protein
MNYKMQMRSLREGVVVGTDYVMVGKGVVRGVVCDSRLPLSPSHTFRREQEGIPFPTIPHFTFHSSHSLHFSLQSIL